MINEAISRKRKTDISIPISLRTHLIRKRTKQHTATIPMSDHAAVLTFVSNHTHTTIHANLTTNFMLIPEVRLFFCFVISFFFSMTFFFCDIRQIGCFLFRIGGKRSERWYRQNFLHKIRSPEEWGKEEDFRQNTPVPEFFVSQLWDTFANRTKNCRLGCLR